MATEARDSRGLGKEMCYAFAQCGADVIVASRKIDNCVKVAEDIERTTGRQAMPIACHVGDWNQIDDMLEKVYARFGRIDVLVNNAGMSPLYPSLNEHTEALYDKVFDVNLKGPFRLMARVGHRMAEGDGGSIINVSSGGAVRPNATIIPYAAAKAGLNSMTIGFAHAYGPKVRVNCIQAGPFLTDIAEAWDIEAVTAGMRNNFALERPGNPDEVIGAALYFASDASSWTTGAVLPVDGGMP